MRFLAIVIVALLLAGAAFAGPFATGYTDNPYGDPSNRAYLLNQMDGGASGSGNASQDFEASFDAYDIWFADKFTVPDPGWAVSGASFEWFNSLGLSSCDFGGMNYYFFPLRGDGMPDFDNPVFTHSDGAGTYLIGQVDSFFDVNLAPGDYWFSVQGDLNYTTWGQIFVYNNGNSGMDGAQFNPNEGFGMGSDWWLVDVDMNFALSGEVIPEPGTIAAFASLGLGLLGYAWRRK